MAENKGSNMHTVMPKKLAEALMEAGMKHFDVGGQIAPANPFMPMSPVQSPMPNGTSLSVGSGQNAGSPGAPGSIGGAGQQQANAFGLSGTPLGNVMTGFDQAFGFNDYNAQAPTISNENTMPRIGYQQQVQDQTYRNQNNLANQLLAQSQGQGPNPAQSQLAQDTGQNVATQGALMASQRGANSNPALMARQAAQQGASTQQTAVGQAATLGAQQQLGAQQELGSLYQNQATNALQGESINQGAQAAQNTALTQGQLGTQNINANVSGQNSQHAGGLTGGLLSSLGSALSLSKGGRVQRFDSGGIANYSAPPIQEPALTPYTAFADKSQGSGGGSGGGGAGLGALALLALKSGGDVPGKSPFPGNDKRNDTEPALLSKGEIVLPNTVTQLPEKQMEKKAVEFLKHLKGGKKGGYGDVVASRKYKGGAC